MKKISLFLALALLITVLSGCTDSKGEWGEFGRSYNKTIEKYAKTSVINQKAAFSLRMDYENFLNIKNDKYGKAVYDLFVKNNKITATMDCTIDRKNEVILFKVSAGKITDLKIWLTKDDIYVSAQQAADIIGVFAGIDLSSSKSIFKGSYVSVVGLAPEASGEIKEYLSQMFEQMEASYSPDYSKSGGKILKLMDAYKIIQSTNKGLEKPVLSVTKNNLDVNINYSNISTLIKNLEAFYAKSGKKFDENLSKLMSALVEKTPDLYGTSSVSAMKTNPFKNNQSPILKDLMLGLNGLNKIDNLKMNFNFASNATTKFLLSGKMEGEAINISALSKYQSAKSISLPKDMKIIDQKTLETIIAFAIFSAAA